MPKSKKLQFSYDLLLDLQHHQCFYCSKNLQPVGFHHKTARNGYTRDHFFPRSWGNLLKGNTVLACEKCNRKKGNLLPSREEVLRFNYIYSHIADGPSIDLSEFLLTQRLIDILNDIIGLPLDTPHCI